MRKYLIGFLVGAILFVPLGVRAWSGRQMAQAIYGFDCAMADKLDAENNYLDANGNKTTYEHKIPDPNSDDSRCSGTVYVFDDAGNKCYVVKVSNGAGINCVRGSK